MPTTRKANSLKLCTNSTNAVVLFFHLLQKMSKLLFLGLEVL